MKITVNSSDQGTTYHLLFNTIDKLKNVNDTLFQSLNTDGVSMFKGYALKNGFDGQKDFLLILKAEYDPDGKNTNRLTFETEYLTYAKDQSISANSKRLFIIVHRSKPLAHYILGHLHSETIVTFDLN